MSSPPISSSSSATYSATRGATACGRRFHLHSEVRHMTIRRQLTLSYLGILSLLSANLITYLWTNAKRNAAFEDLGRTMSRQSLISSVQRQAGDYQKQVTLLSQLAGESDLRSPSLEELDEFNRHLDSIQEQIQNVVQLASAEDRKDIEECATMMADLNASWKLFYRTCCRACRMTKGRSRRGRKPIFMK